MKTYKQLVEEIFIEEATPAGHEAEAKRRYEKLHSATSSTGSHRGNVRVYYDHKGGSLSRTFVGDHDHHSYATPTPTSGPGHYFGMRYSAGKGHEVHTHVKLKKSTDLSDHEGLVKEIQKQNPHTKGTGHAHSLASAIVDYHGKK
jgi:hypothetical protein